MIPSLTSLVLLDRRDPKLLLVQPYFALNSAPLRLPVLGEVHSHMGTLRLAALVVLVPYGH